MMATVVIGPFVLKFQQAEWTSLFPLTEASLVGDGQ